MNRYTGRTLALEMVMIAVGIVFAFPVYVLVNLAVRPPADTSSPIAPTTSPTFGNFTGAWREAGLGGALINSVLVTVVSVVVVLAVSALAAYPLARSTARWSRTTFLAIMLGGAANYLVSLTNTIWGRYDFPMAYKVLKPMVAAIGALGVSVVGIIGRSVSYSVAYGVLAGLTVIAFILVSCVDDKLIGRN